MGDWNRPKPPTTHSINIEALGLPPGATILGAIYPDDPSFPAISAWGSGTMLWFSVPKSYRGYATVNIACDPYPLQQTKLYVAGVQQDLTYSGPIDAVTFPPPIPPRPSPEKVNHWRGAFCIPQACPGLPFDGQYYGPSYGMQDDAGRAQMRQAYLDRGYTHFVYDWRGDVYGDDYGTLAPDVNRAFRDLLELRQAGFVNVVCIDSSDLTLAQALIDKCAELIDWVFPFWEMNGALFGNNVYVVDQWDDAAHRWIAQAGAPASYCLTDNIVSVRQMCPSPIKLGVHFTPGHGAAGDNEPLWWQCVAGVTPYYPRLVDALFSQDDKWGDPTGAGLGFESTAVRLLGIQGGWEPMAQNPCLDVAFEQTTSMTYRDPTHTADWTEQMQVDYMTTFLQQAPHAAGSCDGIR